MKIRRTIVKLSGLLALAISLSTLQPPPASAFEPVFEIRAKNGTAVVGAPFQRLAGVMDPDNSVRIGLELRSGLWIGYSSQHGLATVYEY
jgi:hypothetical protein